MSVYRQPPPTEIEKAPRGELVYAAVDRSTSQSSEAALFKAVMVPGLTGVGLAMLFDGTIGLLGMVVALPLVLALGRRGAGKSVLSIANRQLTVRRGSTSTTVELDEVENVELEIKTIQRVQEGSSVVPAARFIDSTVGPEIDTARIVIVGPNGPIVRLTEEYVAHVDAIEWLGKIRVFLRKHEWLPADERDDLQDASRDEE